VSKSLDFSSSSRRTEYQPSKQVIRSDSARSTTGWWFSESIQPGSFFSEPKKFEPGPTHHGLVG